MKRRTPVKILITNKQKKTEFTKEYRELIKKTVRYVLNKSDLGSNREVSVTVVDNDEIRRINKEFRGIDSITDVLSFPMLEFTEPEKPAADEEGEIEMPLGDIVISLEKAVAQAEEYGHKAEREIAFLTVHSMLHLLGYDHIEEKDRQIMRAKEKQLMKELGLEEEYDK